MQIFNTLTRQKEEFVPQVPGEYRIYVCGPTVYNYIHIGNARPLIVFDTLRRYLEYRGNKVIYVSNITDIDDKLIKKGQEEGTSMKEVAQRFEAEYLKDAAGLNCKKPTVQPRATEHIPQILDIVKDLIDSGKAGKVLGARAFVTWCRGAAYYTESGWRGSLKTEGGGVLINQSVHTQDLLCFLLGDPTTVDATMTNHHLKDVIEVEDTLEAYIDFNGVHASFYATTSYCADVAPLIEIACEHMTIRVEDPHVTVSPKDAAPYQLSVETLPPIGKSYWGTGHTACISDFYQSLRDNRRFLLNLETMEPSIRLMLGTYESARSGHSVTLIEQ